MRRLICLIVAVLAAALVAPATAFAADTTTPTLTNVTASGKMSSPHATITLSYTGTDDSGTISFVNFTYLDPIGRTVNITTSNATGQSGSASIQVPESWPNGTYLLQSIAAYDPTGNIVTYMRDGSVTHSPDGASGPTTNSFAFSSYDLSISGSNADITTPTLTSFSVSGSKAFTPGQTITINYAATDASGHLKTVIFFYKDALGGSRTVSDTSDNGMLPLSGTVQKLIPANWPNGTYQLSNILLYDPYDNGIEYLRNGTEFHIPSGAQGPTSNPFTLSTGDISVSGSSADTDAPTLTSFSVAPRIVKTGDTLTVSYQATESSGHLNTIVFDYQDPLGGTPSIAKTFGVGLSGQIQQVVPASWPAGTYTLQTIDVYDDANNHAYYKRDGTVQLFPSGITGPTTNSFSLSDGDFVVQTVPAAPSGVTAKAAHAAATVTWTQPASNGRAITGYDVEYSSDNGANWNPGPSAANTSTATTQVVTGLVNGTSYRFRVAAINDIGMGEYSTASAAVTPTPKPDVSAAAIAAKPAHIMFKESAIVTGTLTDSATHRHVGGVPMLLQQRSTPHSAWSAGKPHQTSAAGVARAAVAPSRNTSYRWVFKGDVAHAAVASRSLTVHVASLVKASLTHSTVKHGHAVIVRGTVRPGGPGERVVLQEKRHGHWQTVGKAAPVRQLRAKKDWSWILERTEHRLGEHEARVLCLATSHNAVGVSQELHFAVI